MQAAVEALQSLDRVVAGLLDAWDHGRGTIVITSDHGNMEDLSIRTHTANPVPTILIGREHRKLADEIHDLTDIAPAVVRTVSGQG
jgi:bisphosphoglycerate-independent phosphoglycerate mutase (AlkP superfamily)